VDEDTRDGEEPTLEIAVRFDGEPPASLVLQTVNVIEQEAYQLSRAEMEFALEAVEGITGAQKAACRRDIEEFRGLSIRLTDASRGSVLLLASLTVLGYWVLEKTVGETLKEAYVESDLHARLKAILLSRLRRQAGDLEGALKSRLVRFTTDAPVIADVRLQELRPGAHRIDVAVRLGPGHPVVPPTLIEWWRLTPR
jgi:hypothetical protein